MPRMVQPRRARGRGAALASVVALAALLTAGACRPRSVRGVQPTRAPVALPADAPEETLLLIGDAGAPRPGEPVLAAVRAAARERPGSTRVVFLGDNVYQAGIPPITARDAAEKRARLDAQIDVVGEASGHFVPGNHDWGADYKDPRRVWQTGVPTLAREEAYLRERRQGGARVALVPPAGCAGPAAPLDGSRFRVLALDTQWWIAAAAAPPVALPVPGSDPACAPRTLGEATAALRGALGASGSAPRDGAGARHVVVVGHHPLASNGDHGVHATSMQDVGHPTYRTFRDSLLAAMRAAPPLVYAAGHDHQLQLFEGPGARWSVVSGSGSASKVEGFAAAQPTVFGRAAPGYVRLDAWGGGRVALRAVTVGRSASDTTVALCRWLAPEAVAGAPC